MIIMDHVKKIGPINTFSYIVVGMGFIFMLHIWFMLLYPYKTVEITAPAVVLNEGKVVKRGEPVLYQVQYCKYTDNSAMVYRSLVDSIVINFPTFSSNLPRGCSTYTGETPNVPLTTQVGKYHLNIRLEYKMNALRTISHEFNTEDFTIK